MKTKISDFYRYFVYVSLGVIEYFRADEYEIAKAYADAHGSTVSNS